MSLLIGTRRARLEGQKKRIFRFQPGLATFTPKMAKRTSTLFGAAPIIQGAMNDTDACDVVTYSRGSQVSGFFYDVLDIYQGTICFRITPEWDGDDGLNHSIIGISAALQIIKNSANNLRLAINSTALIDVDVSAWTAGTTYFVAISWDADKDIDGTNYVRVSINDTHSFDRASAITPVAPHTAQYFGVAWSGTRPANAIVEGLTIYRRVLGDGTYGNPATAGVDELNLIYASGAGKKPWEVCPEDVVMAFPTNGTAGELATGTREAFYFPYRADNELSNWHMQDDTGGAPTGWTARLAPTLADGATADILFGTRVQKISVDAANEGISQDYAVTAGNDYWVGVWVKDDGVNKGVYVTAYDVDNTTAILNVITTDSGEWEYLTFCFEAPAGCTSVRIFIRSSDADTYDYHVQQCMVLPNLVNNGGMEGTYVDESGGGGGTVNVAPGWAKSLVETDGTDELSESADAHSGSASQKIDVDAANEGIVTDAQLATDAAKWYLFTTWLKATAGTIRLHHGEASNLDKTFTPAAVWTRHAFVAQGDAGGYLYIRSSGGAATFYVDDVSVIELDDLTITATAASLANSTESGGIRVDGYDTLTQTIPTGYLGATEGKVAFKWTPRHDDGDFGKFGNLGEYVTLIYKDSDNRIYLRSTTAAALKLSIEVVNVTTDGSAIDVTGLITPGQTYLIEIEYTPTKCTWSLDGVLKDTITPGAGIDFGANIPDTFYAGTQQTGAFQQDCVISAP